jgi:hypothetical protein
MFMRIFDPGRTLLISGLALVLASCSDAKPDNSRLAEVEEKAAKAAEEDGRILCALDGDEKFSRTCTMDRVAGQNGEEIVLSRGDGGFRRLRLLSGGRGVEAADGAEPAKQSIVEVGMLDVAIGADRYRLPAATKPKDTAPQASKAN